MKILVVSQYFYPENFRINQLCLDLKERGHQITVLTGKPNYPQGEYYEGYSYKGNDDEIWKEIPIIRVPLRARRKGAKNLILNYLSFVKNANKKVKDIKENFDLIYVFEVSPITVALPAIKLKKKLNIPIIINIQDLWPENIIAVTGIDNPLIIGCVNKLVNYIYKNCDLILCASPSFVEKIKVRTYNRVEYWPQYSTVEKYSNEIDLFNNNQFNITFTGNIGEAQGLDIAIKAAKKLENEKIHWNFIGDGRNRENLEKLVKDLNIQDKVTFHGFINEKEIPKYLASSDCALLILKPDPVFDMTIPAKLQTYLNCGVPIVGCVNGESKKIIEETSSGVTSDTVTVEELAMSVKKIADMDVLELKKLKNNAIISGNNLFNKNKLLCRLEKYMEEIIK